MGLILSLYGFTRSSISREWPSNFQYWGVLSAFLKMLNNIFQLQPIILFKTNF